MSAAIITSPLDKLKVKDLIEQLQRCPPDSWVVWPAPGRLLPEGVIEGVDLSTITKHNVVIK